MGPSPFRGRYLVGHLVVLALAVLFVRLGFWQLDRHEQVRTRNELIGSRMRAPVTSLETVLPPGSEGREAAYRRVTAAGSYLETGQVVVAFRSHQGNPGHWMLTPLLTEDGSAVMVNRGWIPLDALEEGVVPAAPSAGEVRVTGLLLPSERVEGTVVESSGPVPQVRGVDLGRLQDRVPVPLRPLYLQLERQEPPVGPLPATVPPPSLDDGPHLSYGVQWFLFAAVGLVGWPILVVRSVRGPQAPVRRSEEPVRSGRR